MNSDRRSFLKQFSGTAAAEAEDITEEGEDQIMVEAVEGAAG